MKRTRSPGSRLPGLVRTHVWLVVLATFLALGAAVAAAATRPVTYKSTAEVVVGPEDTGSTPLRPEMGTELAVARSGVVTDDAAATLGTSSAAAKEGMSASVVLESSVLRISYTARTPSAALRGARAFVGAYVTYRNSTAPNPVARVVTPATLPTSGARGDVPIVLTLGLLAGLAVGICAAWLWDRLSDRVRHAAELEERTGLPVLAQVPRWPNTRAPLHGEGLARESIAYVAARLGSMAANGSGRTIVVTSPRAGAGTTSVACGAAAALAAQGKEVVLIGANHEGLLPEQLLGVEASPGLRELLAGRCSLEQVLHPTWLPHLRVIAAGEPAEIEGPLDLEQMPLVLSRLDARTLVVIDAPPLLGSADSLRLADLADLVVLVGDLTSGTRSDVQQALATLGEMRARVAGWVSNVPPARFPDRAGVPDQASLQSRSMAVAASTPKTSQPPVPAQLSPAPVRPSAVSKRARQHPGRQLPEFPRRTAPPRDGDRRVPAPGASPRR